MLRTPAWLVLISLGVSQAPDAWATSGQDWPEYLGGANRDHYSTLDQINASNVGTLKVAWEFHSGDFGQMQCNSLIVEGVLYGATASCQVFALDAATGRQLWRFSVPGKLNEGLANDRGVTYWADGGKQADSLHGQLLALRARCPHRQADP